MTSPAPRIRPIDPGAPDELEFVARGMRKTLMEVEGDEAGAALYTLEWLRERVRFHLDAARCEGAVFVAQGASGLVGHTIVRVEPDDRGRPHGLFSTTWVEPSARRAGVAQALLARGEAWMQERGLPAASTWTSATNAALIALYARNGYAQVEAGPNAQNGTPMVRLARALPAAA